MSALEVLAYSFSLLSLILLSNRKAVLGYAVGALDVIPWCLLAVTQWDSPGMLVLEGVYLAVNLYGLYKHRKEPLWASPPPSLPPTSAPASTASGPP